MSMASVTDNAPIDPDDELLVAYLDGELDRQQRTELENRLLEDARLRGRLQQLQTGWDLLDDLPQPAGSMKLVESTLELAVADLVKANPPTEARWKRWQTPMAVLLVCVVGAGSAIAISQTRKSQAYQRQLRDLAVAEHLDAYNYGGDLTLMRQLQSNPEWISVKTAAIEIGDINVQPIANLAAIPVDQREATIEELPIEKVDQLDSRWIQFNRLDQINRDRIRKTADAVAQQPDAELLLETMQAYELWRQTLPPELRDRIESNDSKVRREAIDEAIEMTQVSISQRSRMKLDDDTIDAIYFALQYILRRRLDELQDPATIQAFERAKDLPDPEHFTILRMVGGSFYGRGPSSWRRGGPSPGGQSGPGQSRPGPAGAGGPGAGGPGAGGPGRPGDRDRMYPIDTDELELVYGILPSQAQDMLTFIAGGDSLLRTMTLRTWLEETVRRKSPFRRPDGSTLLERYTELDDSYRNVIDLLPPKEILTELARNREVFGGDDR